MDLLKHKFLRNSGNDGPRLLKALVARSVAYEEEHGRPNDDDDDDEQEDFGTENHWDFSTMRASRRYSHKTRLSINNTTAYEAVDDELRTPTPTNLESLSFEEPGLKLSMDGWPTTTSIRTNSPTSPLISSPVQSPLERIEVYVQRPNLLHEPNKSLSETPAAVSGWTGDGGWQGWGGPSPSSKPIPAPQRPVPILPRNLRHSRSKSGSVVGLRPVSVSESKPSPTDTVSTGFSLSMDYENLRSENTAMIEFKEEIEKTVKLLEAIGNNVRLNNWGVLK